MRLAISAVVAAVAAVALLAPESPGISASQSVELLAVTSTVTYDVKATDEAVHVAWSVTVTNNDPDTALTGGQTSYYSALRLPVLIGATNVSAADDSGRGLPVTLEDTDAAAIQTASVAFATRLFYGQSYSLHLAYDVPDTRSRATIVTPYYAYVPIVALGDPATVTVRTATGDPWSVSVILQECAQSADTFTCSGSGNAYLAAIAELSQPGGTSTSSFTVPLADGELSVNLTSFQGEETTAQHQQALIAAGLPTIEQTYGFDYAGPDVLNVTQGGQQAVLGYEGLASCDDDSCDVVVSPVASDYTLLHELSHLWTGIYGKRWLEEGFAELVAETAGPLLPPGLVTGDPPTRAPSTISLQLDTWGPTSSLIAADPEKLAIEDAGYDYSLRFLQQLRDQYGMKALQAVNRNVATSGRPADSRRFMDLLEDATRQSADNLFLVWVFPDSYRQVLTDRREARDRLESLQERLSDDGLPGDVITPIQSQIDQWSFGEALAALDVAEAGLQTYADLLPQLNALNTAAQAAGLELPGTIDTALTRFDFDSARRDLASAEDAVAAYAAADARVHAGRSLWTKFGLLGSDPGGTLGAARESFANGDFEASRTHSEHALHLIADASSVAYKRLLIVAGFLAILAFAVGIAVAVGRFRERRLAEP